MKIVILSLSLSLLMAGCASITSSSTQLIRFDALDENGANVADAKCTMKNDKGEYIVDAGHGVEVHKSSKNLTVVCDTPTRADKATGDLISRVGAGMFGNIVFGGGIGAIIDHTSGTAYNYPDWVQLVFGKSLIFDRHKNVTGKPLIGSEPEPEKINKTKP